MIITDVHAAAIVIQKKNSRLTSIYPVKAVKKIRSWNLDVIHSQTEFAIGTFARLIAKQYNIPLVHTYHTMYEDYIHYITKGYFQKSSKKLLEYFTKFYCDTTATELIVPTTKTYKLFTEKYKFEKNIHIIPTGIEVERFFKENIKEADVSDLRKRLKLNKKDFIILFVGRLAEEKNVEFLIYAQQELVKKSKNIKLIIVGDGPDKEKYETRVLIDGPSLLSNLTGFENLKLLANIQNKISDEEIMFYVKKLNLEKFINVKYSKYSLGTKQKLGIVQALMENPDMIVLDEPFNGIEKETIPIIKELLKEEKQKNKIILLASHIENDLNDLCDEIFEVDNGNILKIK